ncbi:uncharacterized protein LOC129927644 [Biomphalaria glabrata]|uniref:Uncharacterized protein LOC129927644 n=1 Tax=Biomphalaria glabrata TaxID=6526 RepID=A0A9W3B231_BIOGL|nr:uncharacterized protein LOC129927644 [Biomphalaria glabrata]XP_055893520.1 uncharacterized protein LOC129927644 [Biomphalaria glabrata]XP_055893521.1 uncharacterized protein LOC129927644 [Biomphalaria glabrata]XP_055893522.1 uncharacterized protein LOC129927644 [Biomphalaria glabrata]
MPRNLTKNPYELRRRLVKGLRMAVSSRTACDKSATGNKKQTSSKHLNLLQLNILGLQNKTTELQHILKKHDIHIALLQETLLPKKKINITGYTQYRCLCTKCQGIMTLIRNDTQATVKQIQNNTDIDTQEILLWREGTKYTIKNYYCPPSSTAEINIQLPHYTRTIIAGDFNAHTPSLGYPHYNKEIEDVTNASNLHLLQNKTTPPTFLHRAHNTTSRPDLTFISTDITDSSKITVLEDIGSDHRPILLNIGTPGRYQSNKTTRWNYKKANWAAFSQETDTRLSSIIETDINSTYTTIVSNILQAAKKYIPRGQVKKYKPFWTPELDKLVKERNMARKTIKKKTTRENKTTYNKLTGLIRYKIKTEKKKKWTTTCEQLDGWSKGLDPSAPTSRKATNNKPPTYKRH